MKYINTMAGCFTHFVLFNFMANVPAALELGYL